MFLTTKPNLYPMGTGLDRLVDEFFENSFKEIGVNKYPATDIYTEDGITYIEVAVTGFSEEDINIHIDNSILTIEGKKEDKSEEDSKNYHTKNIARRSFKRQFSLTDRVEDAKAYIENGILKIELIEVPEVETKKQIKIGLKNKNRRDK